jgi:hypothetical protein
MAAESSTARKQTPPAKSTAAPAKKAEPAKDTRKPREIKHGEMTAVLTPAPGKKWSWKIEGGIIGSLYGGKPSTGLNNSEDAAENQVQIRFGMFDRLAKQAVERKEREDKAARVKAERQAEREAAAKAKADKN